MDLLEPINRFLLCQTPDKWVSSAMENQETLLIDHANCEKKAASTAMNLIYRYISYPDLLNKLSRLAREELKHFEQVLAIMQKRQVDYVYVSPSRYAGRLRNELSKNDPEKLIDTLLVGAIIEARSCERFARLIPVLDEELGRFYTSLLKSEARHFTDYLDLARCYHEQDCQDYDIDSRLQHFLQVDADLISSADVDFRFHSGIPS